MVCKTLNEALKKSYELCLNHNNIWVIGGTQLFEEI